MRDPATHDASDDFVRLAITPADRCVYLPDRDHRLSVHILLRHTRERFDDILSRGFRRSGVVQYVPECPGGCTECVPIRVPVADFKPSKSQRRVWKRCEGEFSVRFLPPSYSDEHFTLYNRHARHVSDSAPVAGRDEYVHFLVETPGDTWHVEYRLDRKLVGLGVLDVGQQAASSVYFFWDPDHAEYGLGTYSALREIEWCREQGIGFYYLGYWIRDCASMSYKNRFRPFELMDWKTNEWTRSDA